jgi:predicted methyltransferase
MGVPPEPGIPALIGAPAPPLVAPPAPLPADDDEVPAVVFGAPAPAPEPAPFRTSSFVSELQPTTKSASTRLCVALVTYGVRIARVFAPRLGLSRSRRGMRRDMFKPRALEIFTFAPFVVSALVACASSEPSPQTPTAVAPPASATAAASAPAAASSVPVAVTVSPAVASAVAAPDRSAEDRALDAGRKPDLVLSFFGIAPGMRVAELGAGLGYTSELLARVVGPTGKVYGQNIKSFLERFAEGPWSERLKKPVMANVVRVDRELDEPLPPDAKNLDAVLSILIYHDTVWLGADRERMNRAVFAALKPGGVYGIVDHSGRDGTGTSEAQTLHRIEEKVLKEEVMRAGFVLDAEADFLRNPADARDWSASPRTAGEKRGTSDRFVLRFKKPG